MTSVPVDEVVPGEGPVGVLLLHGLTGTPAEMAPVAEALAGKFPLFVVRVAGHGTSVEDLARTSWADWYASAIAGADALLAATPRIVIVGLSMGALLAVRLAIERRDAVAGVVLLSPAIELGRVWVRRLRLALKLLAAADARPTVQGWLSRLAMTKGGSDIADLEVRAHHPGYRRVPLRALLNILELQRLVWAAAPALSQPTLVVHAANDHTCPIDGARRLFARLGSSEKRMVELERCFHVITVDCERDRVIAEVAAFLADAAPGSSSTKPA
jgi:carboxylesterase